MREKNAKMRSEIKVRLVVTDFTCSPSEITHTLGIRPTTTWLCGTPIPKTTMAYEQNGWRLDSPGRPNGTLEEQVDALLRVVTRHNEKFKKLPPESEIELSCIIYSYGGDRPSMSFSKDVVRKLGVLNASIDIDLYVL